MGLLFHSRIGKEKILFFSGFIFYADKSEGDFEIAIKMVR